MFVKPKLKGFTDIRTCEVCGKAYQTPIENQKYCDIDCRAISNFLSSIKSVCKRKNLPLKATMDRLLSRA